MTIAFKASGAKPLYGFRPVLNAETIHAWAAKSGFTHALPSDDMHVTVIFSKDAFSQRLTQIAESDYRVISEGQIVIRGGKRSVEPLGDKGAVVLKIESAELQREHLRFRDMGASWDFAQYMPHITITYLGGPDLSAPFMGDIVLGPLELKPIDKDWANAIDEVSLKRVNMTIHRKACAFEIKKEPDADGQFEGYLSVFNNVDQGMDVIAPGAFTKSLGAGRKVKLLWQHDTSQPIGVWDELREDDRGLFGKGRISKDVARGAEAMALLKMGAIDGISIGYRTIQAEREGNGSVRKLVEVDLFEASLVTFPMNELATVTDIKSIATERDFEAFLRDAGFSRKEATAIALHGFKAIAGQRDAGQDDAASEGVKALFEQIKRLGDTFNVR